MTAALLFALSGCIPQLPAVDEPCDPWPETGLFKTEVEVEGQTRHALVYVPTSAGPRPMVVALHGGASTPRELADVALLFAQSDQTGAVVVVPEARGGLLRFWNAGDCCGPVDERGNDVNDVAFLDRLVQDLVPATCGSEVLAMGFSNGGMMAQRWACEGETPDALLSMAGPWVGERCAGEPRPALLLHGERDDRVPIDGGAGQGWSSLNYPSLAATAAVWRERNACSELPPVEQKVGIRSCTTWSCQAEVSVCRLEGWSHAWPGGVRSEQAGFDLTEQGYAWFRSFYR